MTGLVEAGSSGASTIASAHPLQSTFSVVVQSTSNPWSGGITSPPDPGGGGGGTAATSIALPKGTTSVSDISATGTISIGYSGFGSQGPAGLVGPPIQRVQFVGGVSGISSATWAPMVGVFGKATASTSKHPDKLNYTKRYPSKVSPQLWQLFYVGAGQTPGGHVETFHVPAGATTLYLGIPDCAPFNSRIVVREITLTTVAAFLSRAELMDPEPEVIKED